MARYRDLASLLREQEGGLIEIYVLDVPEGSWSEVLSAVLHAGYKVSCTLDDGVPRPLDDDTVASLVARPDRFISLELGGTRWWSAMPHADEIDFQGEPQDVRGDEEIRSISAFMAVLHQVTGRPALLVPESLDPQGTQSYLVVGGDLSS